MKKKLLLLGSEGMLGHVSLIKLSEKFLVYTTTKQKKSFLYKRVKIAPDVIFFDKVDLTNFPLLKKIIRKIKPDYILNCAGVINKKINNSTKLNSIIINSLLPHQLAHISDLNNIRFIHISTDCVFDGKKGNYFENDKKSPYDFYGQTKSVGEEFISKNSLIIRTSIIGHEIKSKFGLLEWFFKSKKRISGYNGFNYSGLTTLELQKYILFFLTQKKLTGIINIASKQITKYELLKIIKEVYNKKIIINKNRTVIKNMVLKSKRLKDRIIKKPQNWKKQLEDLKEFYEEKYKYVK